MKKVIEIFEKIASVLEIIIAAIVVVAIVAAIIFSFPEWIKVWKTKDAIQSLNFILEGLFSIIIAAEFLRMLLKPSYKSVIEVLIFLTARHLIVLKNTALDTLLSVICICFLLAVEFLIEKFQSNKPKELK